MKKTITSLKQEGVFKLMFNIGYYLSRKTVSIIFRQPNKKIGLYCGVAVRDLHPLAKEDCFPNYEKLEVDAIQMYTKKKDTVIIVGAHRGVTAVAAARAVGSEGKVIAYEGVEQLANLSRSSLILNQVELQAEIVHGIVETEIELGIGVRGLPPTIKTESLIECDVLSLDCEGAEQQILEKLTIKPSYIFVEVHTALGVDLKKFKETLIEKKYDIILERKMYEDDPTLYFISAKRMK
jgi:hypothetical protein